MPDYKGYVYQELPETLHKELRVGTSAAQSSLTPTSGKKIRVYGYYVSITVLSALTSTLRASISFGTGNVSDPSKVIWSHRVYGGDETTQINMSGINVVGGVNETVTLTNMTFSAGSAVMRCIIFYKEE